MKEIVKTFTGKSVDLYEVIPDTICIEDIAHALSLKCMFNGMCKVFYSYADHALQLAKRIPQTEPGLRIYALLQDVVKAYSNREDHIGNPWKKILTALAIPPLSEIMQVDENYSIIEQMSVVLAAVEKRDLFLYSDNQYMVEEQEEAERKTGFITFIKLPRPDMVMIEVAFFEAFKVYKNDLLEMLSKALNEKRASNPGLSPESPARGDSVANTDSV